MRTRTIAIFQTALLGLFLAPGVRVPAQTAATSTTRELEIKARTYGSYIDDGEHEYAAAISRKATGSKMWQNNVATAKIRVDVTITLLEGNQHGVPSFLTEIESLKKVFFETSTINRYKTNYFLLRDRAYALQDKLTPLLADLDPATRAFINESSQKIRNSSSPEDAGKAEFDQVQSAIDKGAVVKQSGPSTGREVAPGTSAPSAGMASAVDQWMADKNNPQAVAGLEQDLQSGPNGMSAADARAAVAAAGKGDLGALGALLSKYPNNARLRELFEKLAKSGPDGLSSTEAKRLADAYAAGDRAAIARTAAEMAAAHPGNTFVKTLASAGIEDRGTSYQLPAGSKITMANGDIFDERELLDDQGHLKKRIVRSAYTDVKGGQLDSEKVLVNTPKEESGVVVVSQAEEAGSKIEWLFIIKETKREAVGQGFTVSFQLANDGKPENAEFEVTAWEGPDGKKDSSSKDFTVTFPKPGDYSIKAYGRTGKYHSNFIIALPVKF